MLDRLGFTPRGAAMTGADLLLVTGTLHAVAFLIHEWNPDTIPLIPVGIVYLTLGTLIRLDHQRARGWALIAVSLGLCAAFLTLGGDVPTWLYVVYILIDIGILTTLGWSRLQDRRER
jgi:hypothetical protein